MSSSSISPTSSRRGVLKAILVAAATGVPLPTYSKTPSDEQSLESCIGELKSILARMHPGVEVFKTIYQPMPDGGYVFEHTAHPPRIEWSGAGHYEIRENRGDKHTAVLWVDEVWSHMDQCHGYRAYEREAGRQVSVSSYFTKDKLCIVRKVEGGML